MFVFQKKMMNLMHLSLKMLDPSDSWFSSQINTPKLNYQLRKFPFNMQFLVVFQVLDLFILLRIYKTCITGV